MKNQCPLCVHERTMKSHTSAILVACFAIAVSSDFGMSVEVSSMVDLDSDESEETLNSTTLDTIVDQNKSADPLLESVLRASKLAVIGRRRGSELVKASEPRKRRIYPSHVSSGSYKEITNTGFRMLQIDTWFRTQDRIVLVNAVNRYQYETRFCIL